MTTIRIHHHVQDTLAAELIAGALAACARVRLHAYDPTLLGLPPMGGARHHLILWTTSAQQHEVIRALVVALHRRRAPYLLLGRRDAPVPGFAGVDNLWPVFAPGCDWPEYRGMLRKRLDLHEDEAEDHLLRPYVDWATSLTPTEGHYPVTVSLLLAGILIWALLG